MFGHLKLRTLIGYGYAGPKSGKDWESIAVSSVADKNALSGKKIGREPSNYCYSVAVHIPLLPLK